MACIGLIYVAGDSPSSLDYWQYWVASTPSQAHTCRHTSLSGDMQGRVRPHNICQEKNIFLTDISYYPTSTYSTLSVLIFFFKKFSHPCTISHISTFLLKTYCLVEELSLEMNEQQQLFSKTIKFVFLVKSQLFCSDVFATVRRFANTHLPAPPQAWIRHQSFSEVTCRIDFSSHVPTEGHSMLW